MSQEHPPSDVTQAAGPRAPVDSSPIQIAEQHLPRIDGYRITGVLGQGGMGIVYRAVQTKLNRAVALKVLPAMIGKASPSAVARFKREATAAARLHHTNIVPIYDFGESRDAYYYAMELIEGEPLSALIPRFAAAKISTATPGRVADIVHESTAGIPPTPSASASVSGRSDLHIISSSSGRGRAYYQQVASWMADAADALFYAHNEGIIHRDIKPANLILSMDGRIMIADFGLAKSATEESVTVTGSLLGTMRYLSPEQAMTRRLPVDHRTDIYSLGATMYELLCFQPAFPGSDEKQILSAIMTRDPELPRKVTRVVPPELETICLKSLEKDPDARYSTARALAEDLRRYLNDIPIVARKPGMVRRASKFAKRNRALVVSLVAVVLLGSAVTISIGLQRAQVLAKIDGLVSEAQVSELKENWEDAAATYRKALALDRHEPVVLGNLARVLQEQYDRTPQADMKLVDEALDYCEEALRAQPNQPRLANVYGVLLSMAGKYEPAREVFRKELAATPEAPWTWLNIAAVDFLEGNLDAARTNLLHSVERPALDGKPYCHGWRELATLEHYLGDPSAAKTIDKAIECGYGKHPFFHLVRARIRLTSPPVDTARALADAEMADGFASGAEDPYIKRYLALALLREHQPAKALAAATRAQELGDLPVFPKLLMALAEAGLGNAGRAKAAVAEADAVWPNELREHGATKRSRHMGMLWFESADELLKLREEATQDLN